MKKVLALILALAMCFALVACGGDKADDTAKPADSAKPAESAKPADSAKPSSSPADAEKSFEEYTLADWEAYADELFAAGDTDFNVLYIPSWAPAEYFQVSYAIWKEQFADAGIGLEMIGPQQYNVESQMSVLESALASGQYDAIILYPIAPEAFAAVRDSNFDTYGVPIILHGLDPVTEAGHYFFMPNSIFTVNGEQLYDMTAQYVDANKDYFSKYEGKGGIPTVIMGSAQNPVQNVRILKCEELLKADGRFNIIEHYENVASADAMSYAEGTLVKYPEVELIICYGDDQAIGVNTVLESTEVDLSDHLRVMSIDGAYSIAKLMDAQGEDCRIGGTLLSNHPWIGEDIIIYSCKLGIAAAKEGIIIEDLTDRNCDTFINGPNHFYLTPENIGEFFDWYSVLG